MRKRGREMEWEIERKCVCMCVLPVCVCDCTRCCTRQTNAELKTQKQASVMEMEAGKYVSESNRLMSMWSLQHTVRLQGLSFHTHKWCHYLYTFRVYTFFFFLHAYSFKCIYIPSISIQYENQWAETGNVHVFAFIERICITSPQRTEVFNLISPFCRQNTRKRTSNFARKEVDIQRRGVKNK